MGAVKSMSQIMRLLIVTAVTWLCCFKMRRSELGGWIMNRPGR